MGDLSRLSGAAYPTYASLRMLANETTEKEAPKWAAYWSLFSVIRAFGWILEIILSFIPFVGSFTFYIKLALLVYLYNPVTNGAQIVLDKYLTPVVFPVLATPKST